MSIDSFETFQKIIKSKNLLKKYGLDQIGVFGSFARGEPAKDIDIYLDIDTYKIDTLIKFKKELEKISNKEVDLILKKYANPIILYRAQKDMRYVTGQKE